MYFRCNARKGKLEKRLREVGSTMAEVAVASAVFIFILLGIIRLTERAILGRVDQGKRTYAPYNMEDPVPGRKP